MGISLEAYRISIGNFIHKGNYSSSNKVSRKCSYPTVKQSLMSQYLVWLFGVLLILHFWESVKKINHTSQDCDYKSAFYYVGDRTYSLHVALYDDKKCSVFRTLDYFAYSTKTLHLIDFFDDTNFYARYVNGNRRNRGIKMAHWNLGSAHLRNKLNEIETIISDYRPHILGISEANLFKSQNIDDVMLDEYELFTSLTLENPELEVSRIVVYKHKSLVGSLRKDLMNDNFSSIRMEVGLPTSRKLLICNLYREHQHLRQEDNTSLSENEQLARWVTFLDQWEKALSTGKECLVLGDSNLDHLLLGSPDLSKYRHKDLFAALCEKIYPLGVKQCVQGHSHSRHGERQSLIDILYTNCYGKLSNVQAISRGASDHKIITAVRCSKNIVSAPKYTKKRSYKDFNEFQFYDEMKKVSWWQVYASTDINVAVQILTQKINDVLDSMAPIKIFQTRKNYVPWLEKDTRSMMSERDNLLCKAKSTNAREDWNSYRALRNRVTGKLKTDKEDWQKRTLTSCQQDSSKLWGNILSWLKWSNSGAPSKLFINGQLISSPLVLAESMNNFYISKVQTIREDIPKSDGDPLKVLKLMMQNKSSKFSIKPVHPDLVLQILSNLKNSKSSGVDNIDTYIL